VGLDEANDGCLEIFVDPVEDLDPNMAQLVQPIGDYAIALVSLLPHHSNRSNSWWLRLDLPTMSHILVIAGDVRVGH